MLYQAIYRSPIGNLLLKANDKALTTIEFNGVCESDASENVILQNTKFQLDEYFAKKRKTFNIPCETNGSDFQKLVWKQLLQIQYGQQISYSQLSRQMKNPLAIRAIASANGKNPIPIIIPCHRVVGSKGELVGFSGGLWRKQFLLELEGNTLF